MCLPSLGVCPVSSGLTGGGGHNGGRATRGLQGRGRTAAGSAGAAETREGVLSEEAQLSQA
jgi:hypothetical protein